MRSVLVFAALVAAAAADCTFKVKDIPKRQQPVYLSGNKYGLPIGNGAEIRLKAGDSIQVACSGDKIFIESISKKRKRNVSLTKLTCVNNALVSNVNKDVVSIADLTCSERPKPSLQPLGRCWGNHELIGVGYEVENNFYPLYQSCFDKSRAEVLYVQYGVTPQNTYSQTSVKRTGWQGTNYFPKDIDTTYSNNNQQKVMTQTVGAPLANKYLKLLLERGHLAAMTDFVFATGQQATFHFINAAPQWQSINKGNWKMLEMKLRARIGVAGYNTVIYTGTFGVTQLHDQNNHLVDIFLDPQRHQIPVPLYFYKVVYDASRQIGTAFVTINNPYYTMPKIQSLKFCTDHCRGNNAFSWLNWNPDRIDIGYSFCCTVDDFRKFIPHLPPLDARNGLLT